MAEHDYIDEAVTELDLEGEPAGGGDTPAEVTMRAVGCIPWVRDHFLVALASDGRIATRRAKPGAEAFLSDAFIRNDHDAAAAVRGTERAAGFFAVVADTGAGKSTLFSGTRVLNYGEPVAAAAGTTKSGVARAIAALIVQEQSGEPPTLIIDSAKDMVLQAGGNTMKGGLSSGMLYECTRLSAICEAANVRVLAIVNPMTIYTGMSEADMADGLEAVCSGVIKPVRQGDTTYATSWIARGRAIRPDARDAWVPLDTIIDLGGASIPTTERSTRSSKADEFYQVYFPRNVSQ